LKITFLYWDGCPSYELALGRLRKVLREEGLDETPMDIIHIATEADAIRHQFTGSPTIRINGEDIDPPPPNTPYGLACRSYLLEDGRRFPIPSEAMIRRAIRRVRHRPTRPATSD